MAINAISELVEPHWTQVAVKDILRTLWNHRSRQSSSPVPDHSLAARK
jgi:hypothetical protein